MIKAWQEIERLINVNATHRSGFKISDIKTRTITKHMLDEVYELITADNTDDRIDEAIDVLGVVIHYLIKNGVVADKAERMLIEKLGRRFTG